MFRQKLVNILDILQISNKQLSDLSGIDRTVISKFKNGSRIPSASSGTIERLARGICRAAEQDDKKNRLKELLGCATVESDGLETAVKEYLLQGISSAPSDADAMFIKQGNTSFGQRMDAAMRIAELSNIRLSRLLNVDASLISRYRGGERLPRSNKQIMSKLSNILYEKILSAGGQEKMADIMGIPEKNFVEALFHDWLFQQDAARNTLEEGILTMLHTLDAVLDVIPTMQGQPEFVSDRSVSKETLSLYHGIEGLRQAVLRLLMTILEQDGRELWLYSDQELSWLAGDPAFWKNWSALMKLCVAKKVHIRIIHNVYRKNEDMISGINGWIPLYMSGMVQSSYLQNNNSVLAHTFFLCPGIACIEGSNVVGQESAALYHYTTDQQELIAYRRSFDALFQAASPLVQVFEQEPVELKLGDIVIMPDTVTIRGGAFDRKIRTRKLQKKIFSHIRIVIGENFLGVTRMIFPQCTFFVMHPRMIAAFRLFAQMLYEQGEEVTAVETE